MNAVIPTPSLRVYRPRFFPDRIRAGSIRDGGYVLPRHLITSSQALLSLGVEGDWSFEEALLAVVPTLEVTCVDGTTSAEILAARARRELRKALVRFRFAKLPRILRMFRQPEAFRHFFARHQFLSLMVAAPPPQRSRSNHARRLAYSRACRQSRSVGANKNGHRRL
jgi:hypothetical protein